MGRSGHNLYIPPPSCFLHCLEVARLCNLSITQIRYKDPLIVFQKINGRHPTCEEEMEDQENQQRTSAVSLQKAS